ncbi:hypothetical protein COW36_08085 [bacterium (Candidatus Blackallbacteria) CG17_big_fil_post_rev_8_21_14_2_50_48_46]|uniref:DUF2339 domain-containing protein n=1 Tax=bacterium (Candidatus Blackallbacteria) CG17_big_fil_post_rev_8_21_14_2_50_48_46 TaxID=2014261 RepID=A0A2M7G5Z6_9BACT|nr:MAG: hypothetical protein COW64_24625 [bacterium (Candidatus Blackallbacteria) CG18_big_fil_WC_8_21_14_2_50_49_26]PIW17448.1 MAG: hypothetical protein COW36_08085 [bacterium (Candidatus Blackallbacteria) CG17_big_fil_post_rev_8_21_14_2_50_48_46]PIW48302.1 MAG: hypothetical protein COW20_09440 [bacterium (Candidatus Blackallbacteria) CG13_big_fil_rev_8_21_14_2_50_49_14]
MFKHYLFENLKKDVEWLLERNAQLERRVSDLETALAQTEKHTRTSPKLSESAWKRPLVSQSPAIQSTEASPNETEAFPPHTKRPPHQPPAKTEEFQQEILETAFESVEETALDSLQLEAVTDQVDGFTPEALKAMLPQGIETHAMKSPEKIRSATSLEENIGLKWFSRIGIVALVLGIGLLLRLAFKNNWIGYVPRLAMGVSFAFALVAGGHYVTRWEKYIHWGRTLIGGGFALLYFMIYAAYHFEAYRQAIGISELGDIILLSLVVLGAIGMALLHNSKVIVSGAFFLGYTTTFLSNGYETLTLVYGLLLAIGLALLSSLKRWTDIGQAGLNVAYLYFGFWYQQNTELFVLAALSLLFLNLLYTGLVYSLQKQNLPEQKTLVFKVMNVFWFFSYSVILSFNLPEQNIQNSLILLGLVTLFFTAFQWQSFVSWKSENSKDEKHLSLLAMLHGVFTAIMLYYFVAQNTPNFRGLPYLFMTLCYAALFYFASKQGKSELCRSTYLYLTVAALTLTVSLHLNAEVITLVWVIESVILTIASYRFKMKALRYSNYAIDGLIASKLLLVDLVYNFSQEAPITPFQYFVSLCTISSFFVLGYFLFKHQELLEEQEKNLPSVYIWTAALGLLIFLDKSLTGSTLGFAGACLTAALSFWAYQQTDFKTVRQVAYLSGVLTIIQFIHFHFFTPLQMEESLSHGNLYLDGVVLSLLFAIGLSFYKVNAFAVSAPDTQSAEILEEKPLKKQRDFDIAFLDRQSASFYLLSGIYLALAWMASQFSVYLVNLLWLGLIVFLFTIMQKNLQFKSLRVGFYSASYILLIKALLIDFSGMGVTADTPQIFRPIALILMALFFHGIALKFESLKEKLKAPMQPFENHLFPIYSGMGTLTFTVFFIIQLDSFKITLSWALLGVVLMGFGFAKNRKTYRYQGILMFFLSIAKVFILDIAGMDPLFKTLSFIVLGIILLGVAFIYSRYQEKLKEIF